MSEPDAKEPGDVWQIPPENELTTGRDFKIDFVSAAGYFSITNVFRY